MQETEQELSRNQVGTKQSRGRVAARLGEESQTEFRDVLNIIPAESI